MPAKGAPGAEFEVSQTLKDWRRVMIGNSFPSPLSPYFFFKMITTSEPHDGMSVPIEHRFEPYDDNGG